MEMVGGVRHPLGVPASSTVAAQSPSLAHSSRSTPRKRTSQPRPTPSRPRRVLPYHRRLRRLPALQNHQAMSHLRRSRRVLQCHPTPPCHAASPSAALRLSPPHPRAALILWADASPHSTPSLPRPAPSPTWSLTSICALAPSQLLFFTIHVASRLQSRWDSCTEAMRASRFQTFRTAPIRLQAARSRGTTRTRDGE
ncbi:hypothetical protein B0H12DRAFT_472866 [Mycena haematopus]|nr:hypothetical protein B0H12DRAFT_472866 [Mycena haematopus]